MYTRFRISEADYIAAMRLHGRMRPAQRVLFIGSGVLLMLLGLFGPPPLRPVVLGMVLGGAALALLIPWVITPWMARSHYRRYKGMQDEFGIALAEDGLRFESPHAEGTLVWEHVYQWREDARFILVYPMPRLFHFVPKSLAQQGFDVEAVAEQLRRRLGPSR